jgi:hypothetical protein
MGKKIWTENPSKKKWRKKKWGFQILGGFDNQYRITEKKGLETGEKKNGHKI